MEPTDRLVRGMKAFDLGQPITIPVGEQTLGRVLNVLGQPVDDMATITTEMNFRYIGRFRVCGAGDRARNVRERNQGYRPA